MATFGVCSDVTTTPGGNFSWQNSNQQNVVISPQNPPWPLPKPSYTINGTTTSSPIDVPTGAATGSWNLNVLYATSPGGPCQLMATNPKLVINPGKKK